jgi:hypothetical protein
MWSNLGRDHPDKRFLDKYSDLRNNSNNFMHNNTSTLERLGGTDSLSLFYLREHGNRHEFILGSSTTFSMMQDVLFVLTMAFKPKLGVSAGGMAHTHVSL